MFLLKGCKLINWYMSVIVVRLYTSKPKEVPWYLRGPSVDTFAVS